MKKYKLLEKEDNLLRRIVALEDFSNIKKGDKGGYIKKEDNLSQEGNCWVYGDAQVYGNAWVYGDARVSGNAQVYGDARVSCDARVSGNAQVYGNARVYGDAWVFGDARIYGNAQVYTWQLTQDIFSDLTNYIACSLGVYPVNGKYLLYKRVNKIKEGEWTSIYDINFFYKKGEYITIPDYDPDKNLSCGKGIHVSTPFYWNEGDTLIGVEVKVEDVITCQEGKLRVKGITPIEEIKEVNNGKRQI